MNEYKRHCGGFADQPREPWVHESGRRGCAEPECTQPVGPGQRKYCIGHRYEDSVYHAFREEILARRAAKRSRKGPSVCAVPVCTATTDNAQRSYCSYHRTLSASERRELCGKPPLVTKPLTAAQRVHALEWSRAYRRARRANDPEFRAREAQHSKAYRERQKEKANACEGG